MSDAIIVALITAIPTLLVSVASIIANNSIIKFRIEELTKRVEKHNQVVERMAISERDLKTAFNLIDELKNEIGVVNQRIFDITEKGGKTS